MPLNPRPYQSRLVDKAVKQDMIVFLKTGAGKTFIATMLIRELSVDIRGKYSEGAKRSVFVVNSVPLVPQQAKYIRPHLDADLSVGEYYGEKIDLWTAPTWLDEIERNHVLVMSAQILVDIIQHHFINLEQINLIVFDECHHATGKHPYVQILNLIKEKPEIKDHVRYLGLTASLVKTKCNLDKFIESYKSLEKMMGCKIKTSALRTNEEEDPETKDRLNSTAAVKIVIYNGSARNSVILERLDKAIDMCKRLIESLGNPEHADEKVKVELNLLKLTSKTLNALRAVYLELGAWTFRRALDESHAEIRGAVDKSHTLNNDLFGKWLKSLFASLKELTEEQIGCADDEQETPAETVLANSSTKFQCLLDIFKSCDEKEIGSKEFHAIVFVQRIAMAQHLCSLFKRLAKFKEYEHLRCGYLIGNTAISNPEEVENESDFEKQSLTLKAFELKRLNILFATNVVEEGIDIPRCNMIIRFNEPETFGSYYQSKGRARSSNSCYYIMLEAENVEKRLEDFQNFQEIEESQKLVKKKWAKMQVSLDMCKRLDERGEMNENLLFLSSDQWASQHVDLADPEERCLKVKTGTKKHRKLYDYAMADEFTQSHPHLDAELYLYAIRISEAPIDPKEDSDFERMLSGQTQFGFLTRKPIEKIPAFKLYSSYNQFSVHFELVGQNLRLESGKLELLQGLHHAIFNEMLNLCLKFSFEPEESAWGCFPVLLTDSMEIDWSQIESMRMKSENLLDVLDEVQQAADRDEYLIRFKHHKTRKGFYQIQKIDTNLSPLSTIATKEGPRTFQEYFKEREDTETLDLTQPMIEIKRLSGLDLHFLNKKGLVKRKANRCVLGNHFPCEHVNVLPMRKQHLGSLLLLPSVFYRANTVLRARKLCLLLENYFIDAFKLAEIEGRDAKLPYNDRDCRWDDSLKYNKVSVPEDSESNEEDNEAEQEPLPLQDSNNQEQVNELESAPPPVSIRESIDRSKVVASLPNTCHILQCLTLKSANQNFDLERFEILGDCYLKLSVVLRLYCKFANKKEGDLVTIKSMLVSNKNLFKLALSKNLNEYIVADSFDAKENWLAPFMAFGAGAIDNESEATSEEKKLASKTKTTLNDKSLADCVEALIGLYLQKLGGEGAKMFIDWLQFKVSKQEPDEKFSAPIELPEPLLAPRNEFVAQKESELRTKFGHFQKEVLGYEFKNIFYLLEAFTHPSSSRNTFTTSYQRLELVGDAVIDTLITQYIFNDPKEYSPGDLTDLRQALVNNRFLAFLAIKYDFCKSLDYDNPELFSFINKYMALNITYSPWTDFTEPIDPSDVDSDLEDEIPKAIADTFESVAGAIYLDSNCSLDTVWKSYYRFFMPYLEDFKINIPKSPIKALHELKNGKIEQVADECKKIKYENGLEAYTFMIKVEEEVFKAVGRSKELARYKVFKKAYRHFKEPKSS